MSSLQTSWMNVKVCKYKAQCSNKHIVIIILPPCCLAGEVECTLSDILTFSSGSDKIPPTGFAETPTLCRVINIANSIHHPKATNYPCRVWAIQTVCCWATMDLEVFKIMGHKLVSDVLWTHNVMIMTVVVEQSLIYAMYVLIPRFAQLSLEPLFTLVSLVLLSGRVYVHHF